MYQAVMRFLIGTAVLAVILSIADRIPFNPGDLIATLAVAIGASGLTQALITRVFKRTPNRESWLITALILGLIVGPSPLPDIWLPLSLASAAAIASKFFLTWNKRHIFNPAALGVVCMTIVLGSGSSWWVGSLPFTALTAIGGLLIAHKIRRVKSVLIFVVVYLTGLTLSNGSVLGVEASIGLLKSLLFNSPLLFFATVMLIEPATSPTGQRLRQYYAGLVGLGALTIQTLWPAIPYSLELALLTGNILTRIVERSTTLSLTLVRREKLSDSIESFFFESAPQFRFLPGQFLEWSLNHLNPDSRGTRRWFTIASSPQEPLIQLTTRFAEQSSSFKRALRNLTIGQTISAHGLEGDFVLPSDKTKALVFIAGGIGITPFRSMIQYLLESGEPRDITLFYAVQKETDLIFESVLFSAKEAFGLKYVPVVSQASPTWSGLKGRIDSSTLKRECPDITEAIVFVSGPEPMVEDLSVILRSIGVPNASIRQDFFPGYSPLT